MQNRTKGWILEAPAILVLIAAFIGSIYAKVNGLYQIQLAVIIFIGIVVVLFFLGKYFDNKDNNYMVNMQSMNIGAKSVSS